MTYPDILTQLEKEYALDEAYERSLPTCDWCGRRCDPIFDEEMYSLPGGDTVCWDCINACAVRTENYVG